MPASCSNTRKNNLIMFSTSRIILSASALRNNVDFLRKQVLGPETRISAVVKGNAYGHGIETFVPLAETCGVNHFSVFSAGEAWRVLKVRRQPGTIMIMGYIADEELPWAVANEIECFIYDRERLAAIIAAAKESGKPARIHIEVETGMNRTGLTAEELQELLPMLKEGRQHLHLAGVSTHYAGAEHSSNYDRVKAQIGRYERHLAFLKGHGLEPEIRHTACSAATLIFPETQLDLVRLGVLIYGYWPSQETWADYNLTNKHITEESLEPVLTWKTGVMSLKHLKKGESLGYGKHFVATRDSVMAAIPVGYSYGYSRALSNLGEVGIRGERARIAGIVNMNMMMADVTHIPGVQRGDEVILAGRDACGLIKFASFNQAENPLNYEMLARLPSDIPRQLSE
ncbi:MAG: alanine racemase [Bacteroidia bacterium]